MLQINSSPVAIFSLLLCLTLIISSTAWLPSSTHHKRIMSKSPPLSMNKGPPSTSSGIVQGVGDEGCRLSSPSGINTLPIPTQAAVFFGVSAGLYASTVVGITAYEYIASVVPFISSIQRVVFGMNGLLLALAGVSHFKIKNDFMNIMPYQGAWGFWYIPGSKAFHVEWTGVVEFVSGLWLSIATIASFFTSSSVIPYLWSNAVADASLVILALLVVVTPANIFMFTHGARLPVAGPEVPTNFHLIRGIIQVILFINYYELAIPSINAALSF